MGSDRRPKAAEIKRKSEVVTVRLNPKVKYLAELAARRQLRTLSSFVEWAIEDSLLRVPLTYNEIGDAALTIADMASSLWDVDEADRLAKLAFHYPDLLDHEQQRIWKLVRECGLFWRRKLDRVSKEWTWEISESALLWGRLRKHWQTIRNVARGEEPPSALPTWTEHMDDEIPS
jgi:hypothetical protein